MTNMITELKDNEIIVVGTNLNGWHGGGAAAQAEKDFGLKFGFSEGLCGQTYAFPTLDKEMNKVSMSDLISSRNKLYEVAGNNKDYNFLLTPVGTGIASFDIKVIKRLFKKTPDNIIKLF